MKILSWNVNGVRAVQKKGFLDWLGKESPDILGLQVNPSAEVLMAVCAMTGKAAASVL